MGDLALAKFRDKEMLIRITNVDLNDPEEYHYEAETFDGRITGIPLRRNEVDLLEVLPYIDPNWEDC